MMPVLFDILRRKHGRLIEAEQITVNTLVVLYRDHSFLDFFFKFPIICIFVKVNSVIHGRG